MKATLVIEENFNNKGASLMTFTSKNIRSALNKTVKTISQNADNYVKNPGKDFTRNRKLPFEKVIKTMLSLTGKTLYGELSEQFGIKSSAPTVSAFVQQRDKISPKAFEDLFHQFVANTDATITHRGYRLLAVDGSSLHVPTNPKEVDSYHQKANDSKPFNLLHLNAMYDILRKTYADATVEKGENKAFSTMVARNSSNVPTIYIADRGYESYNNFAHVQEKGQKFLIRVKEPTSRNGICHGLSLPTDGAFDISLTLQLSRNQSAQAKRQNLKFIPHNSPFDFLPPKTVKNQEIQSYSLHIRLVRFKLTEDSYETIATNLDENEFDSAALKVLYAKRWGIETSFRSLKFTIGLLYFHSKKTKSLLHEIFAKLIMYNFTQLIISCVSIKKVVRKLVYQINFAVATRICREFFRGNCPSSEAEACIAKHITPIRPLPSKPRKRRNTNPRTDTSFFYRLA